MKGVSYERRVRFGDTDPYGVLYFAALLDIFKEAVDEFFRTRGVNPNEIYRNAGAGFGFPVVRAIADYENPARYDDLLQVECLIKAVGGKSVTFSLSATTGDEMVAKGELTFVSISDKWESIPLPAMIKSLLNS